jgi:hypothetical protein
MIDLRAQKKQLRAVTRLKFLRTPVKELAVPETNSVIAETILAASDSPSRASSISRGVRVLFGAGATSLFAALIIGSFSASGVIDMALAVSLLCVAWIVGVGAVIVSEPLLGLSPKQRWPAAISMSIILAVAIVGVGLYEKSRFPIAIAPSQPTKEGAHFIISAPPLPKDSENLTLTVTNKGDASARVGARTGSYVEVFDHILSEDEEEKGLQVAINVLAPIGSGIDFLKDTTRSNDVPIAKDKYEALAIGKRYLYIFSVTAFTDEVTPAGRSNLASFCGRWDKNLGAGLSCIAHNESRVQR